MPQKKVVAAIVITMLLNRVLLRARVNFAVKNNSQSYFSIGCMKRNPCFIRL